MLHNKGANNFLDKKRLISIKSSNYGTIMDAFCKISELIF